MAKESSKKSMAAALIGEVMAAEPLATVPDPPEEKPKRKTRKSIIDNELLEGPTGEELKKRRIRRRKPAELRKSHNVTLLMTEQTYQKFKTITENEGVSMNGVINRLVKKYIIAHDIDDDLLDI